MPNPARSPRYQAFLERLRAGREQAGLLQSEVAKRLGKPQSYVSKCESGERRLDVIELSDFATIYRLPLTFFVPSTEASARKRRRGRS
jgi:transcriptional regulator with XRE-family HTH domain